VIDEYNLNASFKKQVRLYADASAGRKKLGFSD